MALKAALTPLVLTATQGSADAFVQGSALTGLTGRQAYNCRQITFEITNSLMALGADADFSLAVSRRSKTAMPLLSDTDVLFKWYWAYSMTTSGIAVVANTFVITPQIEVPIVEETLYFQVDSTGSTLTLACVARLELELDTMSDIDRLNLITRSLT